MKKKLAPKKSQKKNKRQRSLTKKNHFRARTHKLKKNKNIKLVPRGSTKQIGEFGGVRYHKGYVYDELRHTVLTISQMSQKDREFVEAKLKTIVSGPEALTLADIPGWACEEIGMHRKIYIVKYHGIEVAVFFKRQLTEIKLASGDRFPEHVLQDPVDAWQRLDILGPSAKRANLVLSSTIKRIEEENFWLKERIMTLDQLNNVLERENKQKEEARSKLAKQLSVFMKRRRKR